MFCNFLSIKLKQYLPALKFFVFHFRQINVKKIPPFEIINKLCYKYFRNCRLFVKIKAYHALFGIFESHQLSGWLPALRVLSDKNRCAINSCYRIMAHLTIDSI